MPKQDELIALLKNFIAFATVADRQKEKTACVRWIQQTFLQEDSGEIVTGDFEVAPYFLLPHPDPVLLWFAHIDVVPAKEDQFVLRMEGEKAFGRGVADMKGAALAFLMAYREARERGTRPPVSILITSDEEVAGRTIPHLLDNGVITSPVAFTPDSNSPGIVTEHKGILWARLTVHGKGGHGALPWATDNPAWKLGQALTVLHESFPSGTEKDWQITLSPTMLEGSAARNQVSDEVHCALDIRFPADTCATADEALARVSAVLSDGCTLREVLRASPLKTDEKHPMVQLVKSVSEEVLGRAVPFVRVHGGTDARYFSERGIPAFLFGPEGGGIHSTAEWVSVPSLMKHYEISTKLLERL